MVEAQPHHFIGVRVPVDLFEPTKLEAKRRGVSLSELVRTSLREAVTPELESAGS